MHSITNERTIIAGDFNATPGSDVIEKMRTRFIDTGIQKTDTALQKNIDERIDYLFITKDITCIENGVISSDASDHLPIFSIIEL
jgi:endonuclease/exonuclease/phosphatase (EEP) superfamily protein YafD